MDREAFFAFVDCLPDAAVILGADGFIIGANELAAVLLRKPLSALQGMSGSALQKRGAQALWYLHGSRSVRLGEEKVEVSVSEVCVDQVDLRLAILRRVPVVDSCKLVDAWQIGAFEQDFETGMRFSTPRLCELLAMKGSVTSLESIGDAFHPDERSFFSEKLEEALVPTGTGRSDFTGRVLGRDGGTLWLHARFSTEFSEVDGLRHPRSTLISLVDVTEQQRVALAVLRHEERLRLATDVTGVGVFDRFILPHGLTPYWSESMRKLLGFDEEEPADPEWFAQRVHSDDAQRMLDAIEAANHPQGDGHVEVSVRWNHPDGNVRRFLIRSSTLFLQSDKVRVATRSIGAVLDVTLQSAAEDELRTRSAILDATPDLVGLADGQERLLFLNVAARLFWGIGEEQSLDGMLIRDFYSHESMQFIREVALPAAAQDGAWSGEFVIRRHDGEMIPMSQVIMAHRVSSGTRYSTVLRDLSKQKLLEEQYRQAQKMEAIGRLAGGVAHDFNNLLSVIMGCGHLARDELRLDHPARLELDEVLLAAERAAGLTRQLLAFGRRQILKPSVLDLRGVLDGMAPMLERLVDESIAIEMLGTEGPVRIKADPTQVEQIVLNLVVNARDAMPYGGKLKLKLSTETVEDGVVSSKLDLPVGSYAVISVSDTGHGMDAETLKQIFEPFFTTKGPGQGTGLGLATVFGIVHQSGGIVEVDSDLGRGTRFDVYLPLSTEDVTAVSVPELAPLTPHSGVVLLAEDDAQLRRMLRSVLTREGFKVLSADSSTEVIEVATAHQGDIDLLLTDVVMPGISGRLLAERVLEFRPDIAVLYMSGYTEDSIVHHGVLEEGLSFLPKPVTPELLLAAIDRVLGRGPATAED